MSDINADNFKEEILTKSGLKKKMKLHVLRMQK
jgi:hypothetical protein